MLFELKKRKGYAYANDNANAKLVDSRIIAFAWRAIQRALASGG